MKATFFFLEIAFLICFTALSTGVTQNNPSPFAIAVSTNPGRIMIARALAQDTPVILLDEPTAFLDLPNRYELCLLLKKLAQEEKKCVLFSTHDLDIALSLCDSIMLIDNPQMYTLPTPEMVASGHIERLFRNESVTFDVQEMRVRIK